MYVGLNDKLLQLVGSIDNVIAIVKSLSFFDTVYDYGADKQ